MSPFISLDDFEKLKLINMKVFFLFRNFDLNKCGISDYIENLSFELYKNKVTPIILSDKEIKSKLLKRSLIVNIPWKLLKIIGYFKKQEKGIFFLQYSPFNYSRTGFSFILIFLILYLSIFKKNIKIVVNLHETRNKFSISPKYFFLFLLHTIQFYLIYYLSIKIYYTNNEFIKDLGVLKKNKCFFLKIFSTIDFQHIKKINQIIFFSSHYSVEKYKLFLNYIKNYQLIKKNFFKIIFLGNVSNSVKSKIILLIKEVNIKNFKFISFCSKKTLSKILSVNKAVFVTNEDNFKINSSFLASAIATNNIFFLLKKSSSCSIIKTKYFVTKDQKIFNKSLDLILRRKSLDFYSNNDKLLDAYSIDFVTKIFIKNFNKLLKV
jgi:sporulation protein YlmC with PRC-barrel domain